MAVISVCKLTLSSLFVLCAANGEGGRGSGIREDSQIIEGLSIKLPLSEVPEVHDLKSATGATDAQVTKVAPRARSARTEAGPAGLRGGPAEETAPADLLLAVAQQLSRDPLALTSSILLVAYLVVQVLLAPKKALTSPEPPKARKTKGAAKSQFAVSINQKLMQMRTWDQLLECALSFTGRTDVVNIVTAVHRSTKLALAHGSTRKLVKDPRLALLLSQLREFLKEEMSMSVRTRAVGNTSWALAKIGYREEKESPESSLFELLQTSFVKHCVDFKPEELMNTVWAFAELSRDARENEERALQVAKAAVLCCDRFADFTLQQVVYFSWALARLSTVGAVRADAEVVIGLLAFKKLIVERATPEISTLTTKNLAMVSWATAHLHKVRPDSAVPVSALLLAVAEDSVRRGLAAFAAGELASVVWALSKCQAKHSGFYAHFRQHLQTHGTAGFSSQDLANVLCAFVNAETGSDAVYQVLADACAKTRGFNRLEKTMVNWAFGQLPHLVAPKLP